MRLLSHALAGAVPAPEIREDMSLHQDLGLDSVGFLTLILEIEDSLQKKIFNTMDLGGIRTVGDLLGVVERPAAS